MDTLSTRERIVSAANKLFYRDGIRAVSVDAVAEEAGITKRSLYYHFKSKDDLIAAYLDYRDLPNLKAFQRWYDEHDGAIEGKIVAIFEHLATSARHPKWKGCGFLRTSAELSNLPGHPAIQVGAAHKLKVERWFANCFTAEGLATPEALARQIRLLLDGAFAVVMLHRDPSYFRTAGEAAYALVTASRSATRK
ncbi:TetR family transcriptional regulator [Neorhizobium sp. SOG26]|uniref:TetR/AcrR family transcriptional regulator n=1 Tax=Neorhizobium turbinariae TaxID=2937795 RepID=A0ABT0IVV4_9HYPH|nr:MULTISPECIES: TetR/AcrR family transcriptional regulator [Neorhizobium]AXV17024.1 TetR family transcriptional regulator [Neorhizobium sp. SOG26]MCK8782012.1 TetR/AcrR family transcriptional regulator [Neorhizobium turbinariae]